MDQREINIIGILKKYYLLHRPKHGKAWDCDYEEAKKCLQGLDGLAETREISNRLLNSFQAQ